MRKKVIIISSIFAVFIFILLALMRPNPANEAVTAQSEMIDAEQEYTVQESHEVYLRNAGENEPVQPCCPDYTAVDLRELPLSAHENYEWILPPVFAEVGSFYNGLLAVQHCCRVGIINMQGEIILPFIYEGFVGTHAHLNASLIERFIEHDMVAARHDGKWGVINFAGEMLIPFEYDVVHIYPESGLATARVGIYPESISTALIEIATGREIVPLWRYQIISPFSSLFTSFDNNIAHVRENDLHGVICTATGETVIPARYQSIRSSLRSADFLLARSGSNWVLYNFRGEVIRTFTEEEIPARRAVFSLSSDFDVRNERILINPSERNALILDLDGNEVIPPVYSDVRMTFLPGGQVSISENWAVVSTDTEHGIICIITGDIVLPLRPRNYANLALSLYDENTAVVIDAVGCEYRERERTFIDIATNTEIPPPESYRGYTEPQTQEGLPYEITFIQYGDYDDYGFGINDLQGNEIFPQNLLSVRRFGENLLRICDEQDGIRQSRLYDFTTWEEILPRHDFIDLPSGGGYSNRRERPFDEGLALINQGGTRWSLSMIGGAWGVITDTGEIVVPAIMNFERVRYESNGIFAVRRDGKWGFIRVEIPA